MTDDLLPESNPSNDLLEDHHFTSEKHPMWEGAKFIMMDASFGARISIYGDCLIYNTFKSDKDGWFIPSYHLNKIIAERLQMPPP